MANICENKMYFQTSSQEDIVTFSEFLREELRTCVSWEDEKEGEYYQAEVYFESRWDFPDNLMKEFTDKLKHPDLCYIRVLSIEEGNYYCAFNVFEDGKWELR